VFLGLGDLDRAADHYAEALDIRQRIGHQQGEASVLAAIAEVRLRRGQPAAARQSLRAALAIFDQLGHPRATETRARLEQVRTEGKKG
jgi:tetratricopeptide (TPR) repeat protein